MKRIVSSLLVFIFSALMLSQGCSAQLYGKDVLIAYLDCIVSGDYSRAFDYLGSSCRVDVDEPPLASDASTTAPTDVPADSPALTQTETPYPLSSESSTRISRQEFIERHTSIFELLGIESISYTINNVQDGQYMCVIDYTMTYRSSFAGDLMYDFELIGKVENGVWRIEWSPSLIFPDMQWGDTVVRARLSARRGEITAGGCVFAQTVDAVSIMATPSKIVSQSAFAAQLGAALGISEEKILNALAKPYNDLSLIAQLYPDELTDELKEKLELIDGVSIDIGSYGTLRDYPYGETLAHLIGYVGSPSAEDVERLNEGRTSEDGLYTTDSVVGRSGIERRYEKELRGTDGYMIFIRSPELINRKTLYKKAAVDGVDIRLSIDIDLQLRLEEILGQVVFNTDEDYSAACVVVMNPKTGELQAASSYPSYDLNTFTRGISAEEYSALEHRKDSPLFNRLTMGLYPPGSTFKPFTAAGAIQTDTISADYVFNGKVVDDYWTPTEYGKWSWPPIKRAKVNYRESGMTMRNCMLHSDNIYFANAALMMGREKFFKFIESIGMDEAIPFDIPLAKPVILKNEEKYNLRLLADMGYGQGQLLVTPIQLAAMFSAFANGGSIPEPYIIEAFYQTDGTDYNAVYTRTPSIWRENVISSYAVSKIVPMLKDVVDVKYNGTGHDLKVNSCVVAGKTGSAEIGDSKSREIAWFIGFRTGVGAEDERLVLVMLEVPTKQQYKSLKFEIARQLLKMSE